MADAKDTNSEPPVGLDIELRRLKRDAERAAGATIKVSALAKRLHLSPSSLYAYLDGTTIPSPIVLDKILHELGAPNSEHRRMADLRDLAEKERRTRRRKGGARPAKVIEAAVEKVADVVLPWQLPPDVRGFTGRVEQIARLDALLTAREQFSAPTVALVSGTPGVGKTALVVHWAHRVRDQLPDGLLYVDLRGFDLEQPRDPAEVLDGFLRSLGVPRDHLPSDLAERTALFRALVDQRKFLVFMDNAASEEQVRPLLPNSPQSLVVVTSRTSLNGLIVRDGAHHIRLPHLPVEDAVSLLQVLIGDNRVDEDQSGATDLVEHCALLPLAIRIGAELATTRRRARLTELAGELRRYHLDLFSAGGDERTAIRTVFSWSYLHLRADRASAFRLLGLHPGQDLDPYTGAALMNIDLPTARMRIDDLVRANLIEEAGDDRYRMHDLLRAYAREEADRHDPAEAAQAMHRLFDHYLGTSAIAMALLAPHDALSRTEIPVPATVLPLGNVGQAMDWLDAERRNLLMMAEIAANGDHPGYAAQMSALLFRYLYTRAHYHDAMALHGLALKVTRNHDRPEIEGWELARIGVIHLRLGHLVEAQDHLVGALALARDAEDGLLETRLFRHLGQIQLNLERYEEALEMLASALPAAQALADRHTEGHLFSAMGAACSRLARHENALTCHYNALLIAEDLGDHELLGTVLNNLGRHYLGVDTDRAELCHQRALALAHEAGNPGLEADSLFELGVVMAESGRTAAARAALSRALVLSAGIGEHHMEEKVRDVLDALPSD